MRLRRLYLRGYANIKNAMDRSEINIDFTKCKNRIVVIRSENGSGKSSIINELHPFFSNPNVFMEDTDIIKTVEFDLNDGTVLAITYHGYKGKTTRSKPNKCFIQRIYPDGNVVELNPNGNMSSGKEIICDLLDINDDYMALSAISANSKGIGAMKPGERKRFMALIVSAIAPYAKMYKILAAKHSNLRSMITALNAKLSQLGNIEVIKSTLDKNEHELKILEKKRDDLLARQSNIKANMSVLDKNGSPIKIYTELLNKRRETQNKIDGIPEEAKTFDELELKEKEKEQIQLETKLEHYKENLDKITSQESTLRSELEADTIKLKSLFDPGLLEDTQTRLQQAEKKMQFYISCFEKLGFHEYNNITEGEYTVAVSAIERFNNTISVLGNQFTPGLVAKSIQYINGDPKVNDYSKLISSLELKLDEVKSSISTQMELISRTEDYSKIPKDCNHLEDCPFINSLVRDRNSMMSNEQYEEAKKTREELISSLDDAKKMLREQDELISCVHQVRDIVKYISSLSKLLRKFPNTENVLDTKHIIDCIVGLVPLDINVSAYKEYTNYVNLISSTSADILSLREKISSLTNQNKESWTLQRSVEEKSTKLTELVSSKQSALALFRDTQNAILLVKQRVEYLSTAKAIKLEYETFSEEIAKISQDIDSMMQNVELYKKYEEELNSVNIEYNDVSMISIPELQKQIEQAKYQMILFDQYRKDYNEYSQLYDKIEMVKQAASINGIQAEIMDYTMNQILSMVNQLSAMMFGGRFSLEKFEITADDFLISFYDAETGSIRPDISMMSASQLGQLSMIISFVLLHNASEKFNIIRLDEVDNNLDNDNRLRFFSLVYTIMQILNFDQAIIISHNVELDLSNCDLIITRLQNVEAYNALLNSGANIIADFMRSK